MFDANKMRKLIKKSHKRHLKLTLSRLRQDIKSAANRENNFIFGYISDNYTWIEKEYITDYFTYRGFKVEWTNSPEKYIKISW